MRPGDAPGRRGGHAGLHAFHAARILAPEGGRALVITDLDLIRAALSTDLDRTAADAAREPIAPGHRWRTPSR